MRQFWRARNGNVVMLVGLALPALVGASALAVDVSVYRLRLAQLQTAADAGALRAAVLLRDQAEAKREAIAFATSNMPAGSGQITKNEDVVFGVYEPITKAFTATNSQPNAVKVTASKASSHGNAEPRFLSKIWGGADTNIRATALAVAQGPKACVFALDPSAAGALAVQGSGRLSAPNCGVQVNSSSNNSLALGGGGTLQAKSTCLVGSYNGGGVTPPAKTSCDVLQDPLKAVAEPTPPAGCSVTNETFSSGTTLASGRTYCGNIRFNDGDMRFQTGIHYFVGATVTFSGTSGVSGANVMFYLDKDSSLKITSSGVYDLTAPDSGPYKGILIFQSRAASGTMSITGSPQMTLGGTIYTPSTSLFLAGSGDISMTAKSGYLIARTIKYTGDIDFRLDAYGGISPSVFGTKATMVQ